MAHRKRAVSCPKCKALMERSFSGSKVGAKVWDGNKLYTNFGDEPLRFRTENDMRHKCREMGVNCGALL